MEGGVAHRQGWPSGTAAFAGVWPLCLEGPHVGLMLCWGYAELRNSF